MLQVEGISGDRENYWHNCLGTLIAWITLNKRCQDEAEVESLNWILKCNFPHVLYACKVYAVKQLESTFYISKHIRQSFKRED